MIVSFLTMTILSLLAVPTEGTGGVFNIEGKTFNESPEIYKSLQDPMYEIYWDFRRCLDQSCEASTNDGKINVAKLAKIENDIADQIWKVTEVFSAWTKNNLPNDSYQLKNIFPVQILLNPGKGEGLENVAVYMDTADFTKNYWDISLSKKKPTIGIGVAEFANDKNEILESLSHEFGHVVYYGLGLPQYSGMHEEAVADLIDTIITGDPFIMPAAAERARAYMQSLMKETKDPRQLHLLRESYRISSFRGIRDFTANVSNYTYPEVYDYPNPYMVSSMINSTFDSMWPAVPSNEFAKAYLSILFDSPSLLAQVDLWPFAVELKNRIAKSATDQGVDWSQVNALFDERLAERGWKPAVLAGKNPRNFTAILEVDPKSSEQKIVVHSPKRENKPTPDDTFRTNALYLGDKVIYDDTCRGADDCEVSFVMKPTMMCLYHPCSCIEAGQPITVETIFRDNITKQVAKYDKAEVSGDIPAGCYHFGQTE